MDEEEAALMVAVRVMGFASTVLEQLQHPQQLSAAGLSCWPSQ